MKVPFWAICESVATQLEKVQFYRGSKTITLRNLSFSWSCLRLAFLKYDWLEKINNCQETDLSYGNFWSSLCCCQSSACMCVCVIYSLLFFLCCLIDRTGAFKMIMSVLWDPNVHQTSDTFYGNKKSRYIQSLFVHVLNYTAFVCYASSYPAKRPHHFHTKTTGLMLTSRGKDTHKPKLVTLCSWKMLTLFFKLSTECWSH